MSSLRRAACALALLLSVYGPPARAQSAAVAETAARDRDAPRAATHGAAAATTLPLYFDPLQGVSSADLVRRALSSNGELTVVRLEVDRTRARLRQAGLRPNPTLDFEHTTGRLTGSAGEAETSVGV